MILYTHLLWKRKTHQPQEPPAGFQGVLWGTPARWCRIAEEVDPDLIEADYEEIEAEEAEKAAK